MPKRRKQVKLPNGFGQIRYLGKGRRNPYAVHPPAKEYYDNGQMKNAAALCYVRDYNTALAVLTAYNLGQYTPGMEHDLYAQPDAIDLVRQKIGRKDDLTFDAVFEEFYKWKYEGKREYSKTAISYAKTIRNKHLSPILYMPIKSITYQDLQRLFDGFESYKRGTISKILVITKEVFRFALAQEYIEKSPADLLRLNMEQDEEHGTPFSIEELRLIYANIDNEVAELITLLCMTGHRFSEYYVVDVDMENLSLYGGIKNKTSKDRIVPIHSFAVPIFERRLKRDGALLLYKYKRYFEKLNTFLKSIGITEKHGWHDCRHTFSKLCEDFEVKENDRKRMLGHTIGDITNDVYGHRDLEDLRMEIEKIDFENIFCSK